MGICESKKESIQGQRETYPNDNIEHRNNINIIYYKKNNDNNIFGIKFVENNKDNIKLIIDGKKSN